MIALREVFFNELSRVFPFGEGRVVDNGFTESEIVLDSSDHIVIDYFIKKI